ncbi:hypothetical protein J6590_023376 [Homalodisca vitripennis]|nr:hypothetical protein J6590_023376 [Homalodisca vitripennis]
MPLINVRLDISRSQLRANWDWVGVRVGGLIQPHAHHPPARLTAIYCRSIKSFQTLLWPALPYYTIPRE